MESQPQQLHVVFLPHVAYGHMIPTIDLARLFAVHGVKVTIITTLLNATLFSRTIERDRELGFDISTHTIKFPYEEAGLPEGCENLDSITSPEMAMNFYKALGLLQQPIEHILDEWRPNCLVADMMFPWATEVAGKLGIPRLYFNGTCFFALCVYHSLRQNDQAYKSIASEFEPFTVPGLPDEIKLTRLQLSDFMKEETENELTKLMDQIIKSEQESYGVLINSFHELEPAYSEHYMNVVGRRAWHIGPVSLCNRNIEDKAQRGKTSSIDQHECLRWLDSKQPNSVIYICFGSMFRFTAPQLLEIAMGLEASGLHFIWVVRMKEKTKNEDEKDDRLPQGFEKRMEGKGLIIRGWAPQMLILDHEAIGGFMTHCGWNSTLESVTAGVPMVTWPLCAEQFYNEKLITDVLKIGVGVGAQEWSRWTEDKKIILKNEEIQKAVSRVMVGEEAEEMRNRVMVLKDMARRAIEEGGSSYSDLNSLLEELRVYSPLESSK